MKRTVLSYFFSLLALSLFSQEEPDYSKNFKPSVIVDYIYGELHSSLDVPGQGNSHYIKLSLLNQTGTQKGSFFTDYGSPQVGFSTLFGTLGQTDILGYVIGVYPNWTFHFYEDKSLGWDINIGSGVAYFTKPYDKISNPNNELIGSHISNVSDVSANLVFNFSDAFLIRAGGGIMHFTNWHTAIPNVGANDLTVRIGAVYKPGVLVGLEMPKRRRYEGDTIWRKSIRISYGRHELGYDTYPVDGPKYNIYGISGYISKQFNYIHEMQFGVSYVYYPSYHSLIVNDELYTFFKHFRSSVISVHAGHEFLLQHFGFVTDIGIKIFDPIYRKHLLTENTSSAKIQKILTGRVGVEFYPYRNAFSGKKLSFGMFAKTNLFDADFVEFNMTYTF